jgi:hypothetical protein
MSFPSLADYSPGEVLRDVRGNPLPDESLLVLKHIDRLERENAALRADAERYRWIKRDSARVAGVLEAFVAFSTCDLDREIEIARAKEAQP